MQNTHLNKKNNRPSWLKKTIRISHQQDQLHKMLEGLNLHTVCQSALCPNIAECFDKGTATFMILGNVCTRNCRFCAITSGEPPPVDEDEPRRLAIAALELGLKHVVVTSVTRDDLMDGGAGHFAKVIDQLHKEIPEARVEVLTPDFQGDEAALKKVIASRPDIFNHNLETVPRLYSIARPMADYHRSLSLLEKVSQMNPEIYTKSGIMLGLGESRSEVTKVMRDLRDVGCQIITVGQYLSPTREHLKVTEYIRPEVFLEIEQEAKELGFLSVASGSFVRSSFNAQVAFDMIESGRYRGKT
jgi:lipoic acid synthetase